MKTVRQHRIELAWSVAKLARESGLADKTIRRIEDGEPVYDYTLSAVVQALSKGKGETITIEDLAGVNVVRS
jgi:predicted transcriptional regulator